MKHKLAQAAAYADPRATNRPLATRSSFEHLTNVGPRGGPSQSARVLGTIKGRAGRLGKMVNAAACAAVSQIATSLAAHTGLGHDLCDSKSCNCATFLSRTTHKGKAPKVT